MTSVKVYDLIMMLSIDLTNSGNDSRILFMAGYSLSVSHMWGHMLRDCCSSFWVLCLAGLSILYWWFWEYIVGWAGWLDTCFCKRSRPCGCVLLVIGTRLSRVSVPCNHSHTHMANLAPSSWFSLPGSLAERAWPYVFLILRVTMGTARCNIPAGILLFKL